MDTETDTRPDDRPDGTDDRADRPDDRAEPAPQSSLDVPTVPEIVAPRWPPDEDPFITLGLYDDLI
ncbi:hypothetical protein BJF78_26740 [Pseudonocardia sp. CNS-139]|nr:hypothetical protein BJF78_26740 [Pseudonocardia sp. CNS-139]